MKMVTLLFKIKHSCLRSLVLVWLYCLSAPRLHAQGAGHRVMDQQGRAFATAGGYVAQAICKLACTAR